MIPHPRKMSASVLILAACVLGVAIGLFGLNYWHASKCGGDHRTPEQMDEYIAALDRRLLEAESQVYKNEILLSKIIGAVQSRLAKIESTEIDMITKQAKDEAVKLALVLSKYPAPPIPIFDMDDKYRDAESLADLIDDVFKKESSGEEYKDDVTGRGADDAPKMIISDAEANKKCLEMKEKYQVVVGVSWGNLPYDLQQQWLQYSCDYHLNKL